MYDATRVSAGANGAAGSASAEKPVKEESDAKPGTPRAIEGRLASGGSTSLAATASFDWAKIKVSSPEAWHQATSL